jgi:hypothetical protein
MPELPEVETVRRGLIPVFEGRRIVRAEIRRAGLRIPFPDDLGPWLTGRRVRSIKRRAKYMVMAFDGTDEVLVIHLGMSGRMVIVGAGGANRAQEPGPHDHVVIDTDGGTRVFFNDARRFGLITRAPATALDRHPLFAGLGPEPLAPGFTGAVLAESLKGRGTSIKAALLDQRTARHSTGPVFRPGARPPMSGRSGPFAWLPSSRRSSPKPSPPADRPCATMCGPAASWVTSSTRFRFMAERARPAPAAIAIRLRAAVFAGSFRAGGRPFIVRAANADVVV